MVPVFTAADKGMMGTGRTRRICLPLLLALCLLALVWHTLYWYSEISDDAYISFRYARNLAQGDGLTYNPGERVEGFSNFLWVILLAVQLRCHVTDLGLAAKILGLLCSGGTILLVPLLFRRLYPDLDPLWSVLPAAMLAFNPSFASWTTRGLEVPLFVLLLTAVVLLFASRTHETAAGLTLLMLLFTGLSLSRPEGIMYLAVPAIDAVRHSRDRRRLWHDLTLILVVAAFFVLFLIWRRYYFGELYPNTFFAKITYGLPFFAKPRGTRYVAFFLLQRNRAFTISLILASLTAAAVRRFRFLLLAPVVIGLAYAWYVNGDWMDNYRFLVPILPFLLIGLVGSLAVIPRFTRSRRAAAYALGAVLLLGAWQAAGDLRIDSDTRYMRRGGDLVFKDRHTWWIAPWRLPQRGFEPPLWEPSRWVMENARESSLTAFPDIGFLGYVTNARIYDTQGLVNRNVSRLFYLKRKLQNSLEGDLLDDLIFASPDYVFLRVRHDNGEGVNVLEKTLLASPRFARIWLAGFSLPFSRGLDLKLFVKKSVAASPPATVIESRYREAIRWNPRVPYLYAGLHQLYLRLGEREKAEQVAREARARFPHAVSFR